MVYFWLQNEKLTYPYHFYPNIWDVQLKKLGFCLLVGSGRKRVFVEEQSHFGAEGIFWSFLGWALKTQMKSQSQLPGKEKSSKWAGESIQCLNILLPTVLEIELGYYYFYQGRSVTSKMSWGWMEGGWKRQNQKYLFLLKYFVVIKVINIVGKLKNWDYLTRKCNLLKILPFRDPQVTFWCISL